jgi:predicted ATP-dependent serine protease
METVNKTSKSVLYENVQVFKEPTLKTGKEKFDNWFSSDGGIVRSSAIYVSGTSGAGKTTLMVNLMKWLAPKKVSMYLREMEGRSVKSQTSNIEMPKGSAYFADANTCPTFEEYKEELDLLKPEVVIVDSLQVIALEDYEAKGIMSEDKACYHIIKELRDWCSKNNAILFLIGHNTKDGDFAGRNTIIQMMDAHIVMEHDKKNDCRKIYWGQKNRKGPMGMLYYTFGDLEIDFFSSDEWEAENVEERSFIKFIEKAATAYLSTIDKKKEGYSEFKKEYKKIINDISEMSLEESDYSCTAIYIQKVAELTDKYGF